MHQGLSYNTDKKDVNLNLLEVYRTWNIKRLASHDRSTSEIHSANAFYSFHSST